MLSLGILEILSVVSRLFIITMGKKGQKSKIARTSLLQKTTGKQNPEKCEASGGFPPSLLKYDKKTKQRSFQVSALVPSAVFVAKNFLDQHECNSWIQFAENVGFESLCSAQTREYAHRECGRISRTDWEMADMLYQRMKPIVQQIAEQIDISHMDETYAPLTCNGNLRLYRYNKNMSFGRHFDGSQLISRFKGAYTEITVLIYLSDCSGGATRFHLPTSSKKKKSTRSKVEESEGIAFVPEAGAILLHIHGDRCLEHEADPVIDGVKYILRTDIVYAPTQTF